MDFSDLAKNQSQEPSRQVKSSLESDLAKLTKRGRFWSLPYSSVLPHRYHSCSCNSFVMKLVPHHGSSRILVRIPKYPTMSDVN